MADQTISTAPPTTAVPQAPGTPAQQVLAGTDLQVPTGQGVESLVKAPAPFDSQSPPWYTPPGTVWSQMGCAVPQPGTQIVTNNRAIYDLVNFCGRGLFDVMWNFSAERLGTGWPGTSQSLWEMHQLLITARSRLGGISNPVGGTPLIPAKAGKAPRMFLAFPVPFYGQLGCVQRYFGLFAELTMRAMSDAMQHSDNALDFYVSKGFFAQIYPYIQYLLSQMAVTFFGEDPTASQAATYVIPAAKWSAYDPTTQAVSFEATSPEPPLNYVGPTPNNLQNIVALPYEQVIPFLQPWPDATYYMTSGGVWGNASSPASDSTSRDGAQSVSNAGAGATASAAAPLDPSLLTKSGPPAA